MPNESGRLAGKVAIVTGAGSRGPGVGTGKAASTLFAREGASVLLVDAVPERAEDTQVSIEQEGGVASVLQADVTYEADCARDSRGGRCPLRQAGYPVQQCGIGSPGTVVDVEQEDFDRVMATNIRSMVFTSKYAVPRMVESGGGSIINISSIAGIRARQQRREHPIRNFQGRRHRAHDADVRASRARRRARQLHCSGSAIHPDGRGQAVGGRA